MFQSKEIKKQAVELKIQADQLRFQIWYHHLVDKWASEVAKIHTELCLHWDSKLLEWTLKQFAIWDDFPYFPSFGQAKRRYYNYEVQRGPAYVLEQRGGAGGSLVWF